MTTSAMTAASEDWLAMKDLIYKNDTYLQKLYENNLFLFLISTDLHDIVHRNTGHDFHLLLTLAHGKEKMSVLFPEKLTANDDLMVSLKALLREGDKMDKTKSVLKIVVDGITVHLHLHGLLDPGAPLEEINVPSESFTTNGNAHIETTFLSTHDSSKPADTSGFCTKCSTTAVNRLTV
ncbi:hypothetical protein LZ30DRAFT_692065 [Colletotrichum cereale]|nr:hypothetical protein LZ30DRAFT_692065 [Colletotrichum cereale]